MNGRMGVMTSKEIKLVIDKLLEHANLRQLHLIKRIVQAIVK